MRPVDAPDPQGTFYDQWTAIANDPGLSPKQRVEAEAELVEKWIPNPKGMGVSLLDHPEDAILETPLGVFVTKYDDVREVLERDDVLTVASGYGERMAITTGAFMLGMDAGAAYTREKSLILLAMPATDTDAIRRWIRGYVEGAVKEIAKSSNRIDVAADMGYRVPIAFVGHYFGVPGPSEAAWIGWLQMLALYIFNFWADVSPYKEAASTTGLAYQSYIDDTIRQRAAAIAAGADVPDDVLTRMLVKAKADPSDNLDMVAMRRNLGGLAIGSTIAASGNIIFSFDTIMSLRDSDRETFDLICRAARDGDDDLLRNCVLEACRLGVAVPPTLFRIASDDLVLARGTPREKAIAKGTTVIVIPAAAIMDPELFPNPDTFEIDRPERDYMIFGDGMHACIGKAIGEILLTEIARAVFALPGIRRADGPTGHIQNGVGLAGGGYPAHFWLEFDAPGAG